MLDHEKRLHFSVSFIACDSQEHWGHGLLLHFPPTLALSGAPHSSLAEGVLQSVRDPEPSYQLMFTEYM